jgi:hypothetical protein
MSDRTSSDTSDNLIASSLIGQALILVIIYVEDRTSSDTSDNLCLI